MRQSFLNVFLTLFTISATAQEKNSVVGPLSIGDKMPEVTISNVHNFSKTNFRFSELRGKLVILDFWATYCRGCILQFPKLDSLQKKFGTQLQILLVNQQSQKEIEKVFFEEKKIDLLYRNVAVTLPSISNDSILGTLFPHEMIPHEVWIDSNGKVMAITDERSLTETNIRNVLDGYFDLPEKKELLYYEPQKPLLPQIYDSNKGSLKFYSSLIKGIRGLRPSTSKYIIDPARGTVAVTRTTSPILLLYAEALSKGAGYDNPYNDAYFDYGKRIILEVKDSTRYFYDSSTRYDKWFENNCYAYEMVIPLDQRKDMYAYMLSDLNRFFAINGRIEKRKMRCLVIIRTSPNLKFKFEGQLDYQGARHWSDSNNVFHFASTSFKVFRKKLSDYNKNRPLPIVDETGYAGLIKMDLQSPLNDIAALRIELRKKYDLDIIETVKEVEVMILTENGYKK